MEIDFNKPYLTGKEAHYIYEAVYINKQISGNGKFTQKCQSFFEQKYGFLKTLLTTSCTDALEMAAILLDIKPGDEVIVPSYTFVSTVNAFVLRGAKIVFADSNKENPNIDANKIERLITKKTKAIIPVHYGGVSCDMDKIMMIADKYDIFVVEDAAQAIDSYYKGKPLGGIGHLGTFSFHETKNINAGEGGLLIINDKRFIERAEIIWEKGTDRSKFFRGEIDKYGWVDIGSSFLPSDLIAAYLFAQLEHLDEIQTNRKSHWNRYYKNLKVLETENIVKLPVVFDYATNNAHLFYIITADEKERNELLAYLKSCGVMAVFHYLSLHKSRYYTEKHDGRELEYADYYSETLIRLPMFYELKNTEIDYICDKIKSFYKMK